MNVNNKPAISYHEKLVNNQICYSGDIILDYLLVS